MHTNINFPNLHIFLEDVGKNIMIGDFAIAYYGIVICFGMLGGILLATHIAQKSKQNPDDYYDIALYGIIFAVIGARLYYVAFQWEYYRQDFMRIFQIREGGLAIYGGVIAAVIAVYICSRVKKLDFGLVADTACPGLILGQCVGRWGNFFNREAFGGYCDNIFAMQLPVSAVRSSEITAELRENIVVLDDISYIQVHPTFLYESLWNFGLLIIVLFYWKHRKFNGEIFLLYLLGYGMGRFWIESLRTDQLLIPGIGYPVSKALAACMVVGSLTYIVIKRKRHKCQEVQRHESDKGSTSIN